MKRLIRSSVRAKSATYYNYSVAVKYAKDRGIRLSIDPAKLGEGPSPFPGWLANIAGIVAAFEAPATQSAWY